MARSFGQVEIGRKYREQQAKWRIKRPLKAILQVGIDLTDSDIFNAGMSSSKEKYVSGQCNIGPEEVAHRYRLGYAGLILFCLFVSVIELAHLPHLWRITVVIPAGIALAGFGQAIHRFCFMYGLRGVFGMQGYRKVNRIEAASDLRRDRRKAALLIAIVLGGSILITALYYYTSEYARSL